jgi:hypothetical protein
MKFEDHLKHIKKSYPYVEALAAIAFPEFDVKNLTENDPRIKFFSIKKEIGSQDVGGLKDSSSAMNSRV